jgi:hypothetical protein
MKVLLAFLVTTLLCMPVLAQESVRLRAEFPDAAQTQTGEPVDLLVDFGALADGTITAKPKFKVMLAPGKVASAGYCESECFLISLNPRKTQCFSDPTCTDTPIICCSNLAPVLKQPQFVEILGRPGSDDPLDLQVTLKPATPFDISRFQKLSEAAGGGALQ